MIISAPTLDEAYKKASKELNCSIIELDIEVIQHPSSGFLGLFKKEAIIKINLKQNQTKPKKKEEKQKNILKSKETDLNKKLEQQTHKKEHPTKKNIEQIQKEIKDGIQRLLKNSCYDVFLKDFYIKDNIVYIFIDGEDAALLIGKEGYRYKALSYMLHNWIKLKYDLSISLEIAEFLKNQTQNVRAYLESVKEKVDKYKKAQTKPLDGILVKIALEELRKAYPNMYVAIKTLKDGKKTIVVNEHRGQK